MTDDDRFGWWGVWLLDSDPDNLVGACHWIVAACSQAGAVDEAQKTAASELGGQPGLYALIAAERLP